MQVIFRISLKYSRLFSEWVNYLVMQSNCTYFHKIEERYYWSLWVVKQINGTIVKFHIDCHWTLSAFPSSSLLYWLWKPELYSGIFFLSLIKKNNISTVQGSWIAWKSSWAVTNWKGGHSGVFMCKRFLIRPSTSDNIEYKIIKPLAF